MQAPTIPLDAHLAPPRPKQDARAGAYSACNSALYLLLWPLLLSLTLWRTLEHSCAPWLGTLVGLAEGSLVATHALAQFLGARNGLSRLMYGAGPASCLTVPPSRPEAMPPAAAPVHLAGAEALPIVIKVKKRTPAPPQPPPQEHEHEQEQQQPQQRPLAKEDSAAALGKLAAPQAPASPPPAAPVTHAAVAPAAATSSAAPDKSGAAAAPTASTAVADKAPMELARVSAAAEPSSSIAWPSPQRQQHQLPPATEPTTPAITNIKTSVCCVPVGGASPRETVAFQHPEVVEQEHGLHKGPAVRRDFVDQRLESLGRMRVQGEQLLQLSRQEESRTWGEQRADEDAPTRPPAMQRLRSFPIPILDDDDMSTPSGSLAGSPRFQANSSTASEPLGRSGLGA